MRKVHISMVCLLVLSFPAVGQIGDAFSDFLARGAQSEAAGHVQARAIASHLQVRPGQEFHVALILRIDEGWVYYSPDPGPIVLPGKLRVDSAPLIAAEPLWEKPKPKATNLGDKTIINNVYTGKTIVYAPIRVPKTARPGVYEITLIPEGQICALVCINIEGVAGKVSVRVGDSSVSNADWTEDIAAPLRTAKTARQLKTPAKQRPEPPEIVASYEIGALSLWGGLALALVAGVTLNIMPCVLPVIPLRILSIVGMGGGSRRRYVTLGLAFAGGMILFFVALATLSAILRVATDQTVNVSDHFQYPTVRIALAMILTALAVNLFGAFTVVVPSRLAALEAKTTSEGHARSLGMGLMMAVLATPCSFAFLLAAMAWAQVQPLAIGTLAIVLIGVGMAAPHALLAAFPGLVNRLPKPGRWMELFKQSMGFALLLVVVWLIGTLSEESWAFWIAAWAVVLSFCLWMWANWVRYDAPLVRKIIVRSLAAALAVGAGLWMLPRPEPLTVKFEQFDEGRIASARVTGRIVLVKVTASWCTECLVIDHRVYDTPEVAAKLEAMDVLNIKADVTNRGSPVSQWVRREFAAAPPLTIIYPPDGSAPIRLVGAFSKGDLIGVLDGLR